jgi:Fur family transcriptional regulator, iron response regulator
MEQGKELTSAIETKLRDAGVKLTRQRLELARLLFQGRNRHVSAEMLRSEAVCNDISVSLATVYNTLNQFVESGLLREITIDGSKSYFDTKVANHQHFYFEDEGRLVDLEPSEEVIVMVPKLPERTEIARIDVLIRLVKACRP